MFAENIFHLRVYFILIGAKTLSVAFVFLFSVLLSGLLKYQVQAEFSVKRKREYQFVLLNLSFTFSFYSPVARKCSFSGSLWPIK